MTNKTVIRSSVSRAAIARLCYAGIFVALGVVGSMFSFPIFGAKCAPVQHIINIIAGVTLGPWYALVLAFLTSLLRYLLGLGSLLAFPGSMVGAFACGMLFALAKKLCQKYKAGFYLSLSAAFLGEVFGTGILGGMLACPVAILCGINPQAAVFTFVIPFLISTVVGSLIAFIFLTALKSSKALSHFSLFAPIYEEMP